jgi:hypothetical protein
VLDGNPIYTRKQAQVRVNSGRRLLAGVASEFQIDWNIVYLPIVQTRSAEDPVFTFKQWLERMLILRPMPSLIGGESSEETLAPNPEVTDYGAWFFRSNGSCSIRIFQDR